MALDCTATGGGSANLAYLPNMGAGSWSGITMFLRYRRTGTPAAYGTLLEPFPPGAYLVLEVNNTGLIYSYGTGNGGSATLNADAPAALNTWESYAATFEFGAGALYRNGALDDSTTNVPTPNDSWGLIGCYLGSDNGGLTTHAHGHLADVMIWGVPLTPAQVAVQHACRRPVVRLDALMYWNPLFTSASANLAAPDWGRSITWENGIIPPTVDHPPALGARPLWLDNVSGATVPLWPALVD